jgi:hypothetical protein
MSFIALCLLSHLVSSLSFYFVALFCFALSLSYSFCLESCVIFLHFLELLFVIKYLSSFVLSRNELDRSQTRLNQLSLEKVGPLALLHCPVSSVSCLFIVPCLVSAYLFLVLTLILSCLVVTLVLSFLLPFDGLVL